MKKPNWKYTDENGDIHYDCDFIGYAFMIFAIAFTVWVTVELIRIFLI